MPLVRLVVCACFGLTGPVFAAPFSAEPVCDERAKLVAALQEQFGEQHLAVGLEEEGTHMLEIWVSPDNGTWSILMTEPDGTSCLAAAGSDWAVTPSPKQVEGVRH
jgi:hypothetical protein